MSKVVLQSASSDDYKKPLDRGQCFVFLAGLSFILFILIGISCCHVSNSEEHRIPKSARLLVRAVVAVALFVIAAVAGNLNGMQVISIAAVLLVALEQFEEYVLFFNFLFCDSLDLRFRRNDRARRANYSRIRQTKAIRWR